MSLLPSIPRPTSGIQPRTLEGIKRIRVEGSTSYDTNNLGFSPGIPGENAIGINRQATNRKINVSIPVIYKAIPYLSQIAISWIREMRQECLIFIKKEYPKVPKLSLENNRVAMMCLPQLHYHLHELALRETEDITPAWFIRNWFLAGSLVSFKQLQGLTQGNFAPDPLGGSMERTVLLHMKADTRLLNLWGPNVKGGDFLFFVVIEEAITPDTRYVTDEAGLAVQKPGMKGAKNGTIKYVTRLVAVVSDNAHSVATEHLMYMKDCVRHYGRQIYVGRVVNNAFWVKNAAPVVDRMDTRVNNNPHVNYNTMLRCNPLEVHTCMSI